jgi:hypothetical protein
MVVGGATKMDGKPWYSIGKGVNVNLILMSAGVASGVQIKKRVATGSRLVKHKYYSNAIAKKQDCIILKNI